MIRSSRHLGRVPPSGGDGWTVLGQDGGQSIDLGDRTLVVFSDTLLAVDGNGAGPGATVLRANCAALLEGDDLRDGLGRLAFFRGDDGLPREILEPTEEERAARIRFWPAHGLSSGDSVHLYYLGIQMLDEHDPWGFRNVGVGLARLDPATGLCDRIRVGGDWRLWSPRGDDFHLGVQVLEDGDEVLVFGSSRRGLETDALVARAPRDRIADPEAYAFYDPARGSWVAEPGDAEGLGPCGSDFSVSFNRHLGSYLMTYVNGFTKELALRTAERAEGPYSRPHVVGRLPHSPASALVYLAFEHPRFALEGGRRVLVSYCEPRFERSSLVEVCFR